MRARQQGGVPARRQVAVAGEGRSANRTKWASGGDPAGSSSGSMAVAEQAPPAGQEAEQQLQQGRSAQMDPADLVRAAGPRRCYRLYCHWPISLARLLPVPCPMPLHT